MPLGRPRPDLIALVLLFAASPRALSQASCAAFPPPAPGALCIWPAGVLDAATYLGDDPDTGVSRRFHVIPEAIAGDNKHEFNGARITIRYEQRLVDVEPCATDRFFAGVHVFLDLCGPSEVGRDAETTVLSLTTSPPRL